MAPRIKYFREPPFGRLQDGRTLHLARWADGVLGHARRKAVILAFDNAGGWLGPLVEFPGGDWLVERIPGGVRSNQGAGDRTAVATTDGEAVFVGNGHEFRIDVFGADGILERKVGRHFEPIPADETQVKSLMARLRERVGEPPPSVSRAEYEVWLRESEAGIREALARHETMPAFHALEVAQAGRLWVRTGTSSWAYDIFDVDGLWLGSIELPAEPLFFGEESVILTRTDDLGVPFVEVHFLRIGEGT